MEKLMEHTIQRQLAVQGAQLARVTELLERQLTLTPGQPAPVGQQIAQRIEGPAQVNAGPVTNASSVTNNNITQINIRSWSSEEKIVIPIAMLRAAFTENPRLVEYCRLGDYERVDAERAIPYVLEALLDLVRRAHAADPASRNVYLNPGRADQVMVFDEIAWKVITLLEATQALLDSAAVGVRRATLSSESFRELPFDVQASAACIPALYEDEREEYIARAKSSMAAHLTNCRDALSRGTLVVPTPAPASAPTPAPTPAPASPSKPAPVPPSKPAPVPSQVPALVSAPVSVRPITPLRADRASAVLRQNRPPAPGEVSAEYIRALAAAADVDVSRLVLKLWEATEDRLLLDEDALTARAVVTEYDLAPDQYT